ncbi:uncharacterized protein F4822DRAFT_392380 [Hypoxylon trugodes]|uniref:uncharacterized protein n=1 Tax=Hypoxylon trugodes TaxID=326681 RepID=UPI002191D2EF|nr:uncharacterized protein F4822DRAFT_392380 [Hypoxylon trugodes]KAI1392845.1 hypothetical protein F4822DRAFT_392380 [Hypoxylon trugodes]
MTSNPATRTNYKTEPDEYFELLYTYGTRYKDRPPIGEFSHLHTMNILTLFNELSGLDAEMRQSQRATPEQAPLLRILLHQYTNAIRDFKYIMTLSPLEDHQRDSLVTWMESNFEKFVLPHAENRSSNKDQRENAIGGGENHPFDTKYRTLRDAPTQKKDPLRDTLLRVVHGINPSLAWSTEEITIRHADWSDKKPPLLYSPFIDKLARFLMGFASGCFLVVPMIIMIFNHSVVKSVVVVCVAVPLFALTLALFFQATNTETFTATAGYAAVLVVFVGAINPS